MRKYCGCFMTSLNRQCFVSIDELIPQEWSRYCSTASVYVGGMQVCGSDRLSYSNPCHLNAENCKHSRNVSVLYEGLCLPGQLLSRLSTAVTQLQWRLQAANWALATKFLHRCTDESQYTILTGKINKNKIKKYSIPRPLTSWLDCISATEPLSSCWPF